MIADAAHRPVLLEEAVAALALKPEGLAVLDLRPAMRGQMGGHGSERAAAQVADYARVIGDDLADAVDQACSAGSFAWKFTARPGTTVEMACL